EDEQLLIKLNIVNLFLLIVLAVVIWGIHGLWFGSFDVPFSMQGILWGTLIFVVSIPIHELCHGLFFKRLSSSGKVTYGFSKGMFYATNPGVIYTKKQFFVIALAPFVMVSAGYILLYFLGVPSTILWVVFIVHTSACVGDFWYIYEMLKQPAITHCEDTDVWITFYIESE